jgi:hypothetical protein
LVTSTIGLIIVSVIPAFAAELDALAPLHTLRALFIFAPALLAFRMDVDTRLLASVGIWLMAGAVLFVAFMMAVYASGSDAFDAHQTLADQTAGRWMRFHRLGGIVGETGAFGYHALLVFQLLIFFAFLNGWFSAGYALLILFVPYAIFAFAFSQTRISLGNAIIFLVAILASRALFARHTAAMVSLALTAGLVLVLSRLFAGGAGQLLLLRFEGILAGRFEESVDTSGRIEHWLNI